MKCARNVLEMIQATTYGEEGRHPPIDSVVCEEKDAAHKKEKFSRFLVQVHVKYIFFTHKC